MLKIGVDPAGTRTLEPEDGPRNPRKGEKIIDQQDTEGVIVTGNLRACVHPEGCTGARVMVQWPAGRAWECTKAMRFDGTTWRI